MGHRQYVAYLGIENDGDENFLVTLCPDIDEKQGNIVMNSIRLDEPAAHF